MRNKHNRTLCLVYPQTCHLGVGISLIRKLNKTSHGSQPFNRGKTRKPNKENKYKQIKTDTKGMLNAIAKWGNIICYS